jgi:hypothetical protein
VKRGDKEICQNSRDAKSQFGNKIALLSTKFQFVLLLENILPATSVRELLQQAVSVFVRSKSTVQSKSKSTFGRIHMAIVPAMRAGGSIAERMARFFRCLALARRFYPNAHSHSAANSQAFSKDDVFDPMMVRALARRMHALIRFRVAVKLGSITHLERSAALCSDEGWSDDQIGAATVGYDSRLFTEVETLVLRYTDDLTRTPLDVDLATVRRLKQLLTADQLIELSSAISQENRVIRFQVGLGFIRFSVENSHAALNVQHNAEYSESNSTLM